MVLLARYEPSDPTPAVGIIALGIVAFVCLLVVISKIRELIWPKLLGNRMRRFFGRAALRNLKAHDKTFPGYDLGSVHRALGAFLEDRCVSYQTIGGVLGQRSLSELLQADEKNRRAKYRAQAIAYERMLVGVEEDESFPSNCLYFATLKPGAVGTASADGPVKIALLLVMRPTNHVEFREDLTARSALLSMVTLSIACPSREIADAFFKEMEGRRKQNSIYRGKVIEPVIQGAGVQTIEFHRIHRVAENDLVLPESVKALVRGSIVNFYQHQEALRELGVELKRGVLFHSPPGTGKTSICLWLAGLLPNFTVCFVSGKRLLYPRELCSMARYLQPTMLVFEDIDLIAQERDANGLATVLGELMNQIDGCEPNDQVLFIMNTNSMDRLEAAVRNRPGRVDQIIAIPLPDPAARRQLIRHFGRQTRMADDAIDALVDVTDHATPALLKEIVKRAAVSAVTRTDSPANDGDGRADIEVRQSDLLLAAEQVLALRNDRPARGMGFRAAASED